MASLAPFGPGGASNTPPPSMTTTSNQSISNSLARGRKFMKFLCWVELILAVFALTMGSACTGINAGHENTVCTFGTGIWVGLFSLCCAAVGLAAIQPTPAQRKLLIIYFFMCVVGAFASIILLGISSMWIERSSKYYKKDSESYELTSLSLNICLLLAAICQSMGGFFKLYFFKFF